MKKTKTKSAQHISALGCLFPGGRPITITITITGGVAGVTGGVSGVSGAGGSGDSGAAAWAGGVAGVTAGDPWVRKKTL